MLPVSVPAPGVPILSRLDDVAVPLPSHHRMVDFSQADESHNPEYAAPSGEPHIPCDYCSRKFATEDKRERHEASCDANPNRKNRGAFDVAGRRAAAIAEASGASTSLLLPSPPAGGSGAPNHNQSGSGVRGGGVVNGKAVAAAKHRAKWREQSSNLQAIMRQGRGGEAAAGTTAAAAGGDALASDTDDGRVECKGCGKRFAPNVHERHEPSCVARMARAADSATGRGAPTHHAHTASRR